jgi:hypothetical protein
MTGLLDCDSVTWDGVRSAREKATTKATLPLSQTQAAMDTGEAESDTIAYLGRGDISILSALTTQLPDVFYGEILPKLDMLDTLNLAQVSKTYRDTVWSVDGVRSMEPKALTIQMAAKHGNLPAVRALLQSGVNPDEYIDGLHEAGKTPICTALHIAAGAGHLGVAKALIEAGADVNKQETLDDLGGRTPLMLAAVHGHTPVIMELIRAGANVNFATPPSPHIRAITALLVAVLNGHEACVLALIYAGADVHFDGFGEAVMQDIRTANAAAKRNIVEMIRYAASRNFLVLELDSV